MKDQDLLIRALKEEIKSHQGLATECNSLKNRVLALDQAKVKLEKENKALTLQLQEAQNENRGLSTKLAAARQKSVHGADPIGPKAPSSAIKPGPLKGSSSTDGLQEPQLNKLKEDLYRDLTDLVILGTKVVDGEITYDCIQSGRNGSKLNPNCSYTNFLGA